MKFFQNWLVAIVVFEIVFYAAHDHVNTFRLLDKISPQMLIVVKLKIISQLLEIRNQRKVKTEELQTYVKKNTEMVEDYTTDLLRRREDLQKMWKTKQNQLKNCTDKETVTTHVSAVGEIEAAKNMKVAECNIFSKDDNSGKLVFLFRSQGLINGAAHNLAVFSILHPYSCFNYIFLYIRVKH